MTEDLSNLSQIYKCMLKNIAIQSLTTELKYFTYLTKTLNFFEKHNYYAKSKQELTTLKNRFQNYLLKSWNEAKEQGEVRIEKLKEDVERIFKGKAKKKKGSTKEIYRRGIYVQRYSKRDSSLTKGKDGMRKVTACLNFLLEEVENELKIENDNFTNFNDLSNFLKLLFDKDEKDKADDKEVRFADELSSIKGNIHSALMSVKSGAREEGGSIKDDQTTLYENHMKLQKHLSKNSPNLKKMFLDSRSPSRGKASANQSKASMDNYQASFSRSRLSLGKKDKSADQENAHSYRRQSDLSVYRNSFASNGPQFGDSVKTVDQYEDFMKKMERISEQKKKYKKPPNLARSFNSASKLNLSSRNARLKKSRIDSTLKKSNAPKMVNSNKNISKIHERVDPIEIFPKVEKGFFIKNFNKDFVEDGIVNRVIRLSKSRFLLNLEMGKLVIYDLDNCNKVLNPVKISENNILGMALGVKGKIWVSTYKGLYVFDNKLKFIQEVEKTNFDPELQEKPTTLNTCKTDHYIYHLSSPSTLSKINPENYTILERFDRSTIGQDTFEFKILSCRYMINLNTPKNYFKLCNLKDKRKEGGIKLRDSEDNSVSKCLNFDVTLKGSRLFVACYNQNFFKCYLAIYKITHGGFIFKRKIEKFFENGITNIRVVERVYEAQDKEDGFLVISGNKDLSVFSFKGYELENKCRISEMGNHKNVSLCFDRGVAVVTTDNQSINFYNIQQKVLGPKSQFLSKRNSSSSTNQPHLIF